MLLWILQIPLPTFLQTLGQLDSLPIITVTNDVATTIISNNMAELKQL